MEPMPFEGYLIYPDGSVWSQRSQRFLRLQIKRQKHLSPGDGYFHFNCSRKFISVHRLVASLFVPNPDGKPHVNHKDCNKQNNHHSNLEWVTRKENQEHAKANGRYKTAKQLARPKYKGHHAPEKARLAYRLVQMGELSMSQIGKILGASAAWVCRVNARESRKAA